MTEQREYHIQRNMEWLEETVRALAAALDALIEGYEDEYSGVGVHNARIQAAWDALARVGVERRGLEEDEDDEEEVTL